MLVLMSVEKKAHNRHSVVGFYVGQIKRLFASH